VNISSAVAVDVEVEVWSNETLMTQGMVDRVDALPGDAAKFDSEPVHEWNVPWDETAWSGEKVERTLVIVVRYSDQRRRRRWELRAVEGNEGGTPAPVD